MSGFETLTEALIECVRRAGGSKVVGHKLWPEKTVEAAQRHLLNCLNDGKAERLDPDQVLLVAKLARAEGCHAYAQYTADALGYAEPVPLEPRDELGDLLRQYLSSREEDRNRCRRIDALIQQHVGGKS